MFYTIENKVPVQAAHTLEGSLHFLCSPSRYYLAANSHDMGGT